MKLQIIKIGNSLGVRLPKSLISACNFKTVVLAEVKDGVLILAPDTSENPRANWGTEFKKMAKEGDDTLLDPVIFDLEDDKKNWKW